VIRVKEPSLHFNDRPRRTRRCRGDCGGPEPDATLPTPIVYGHVSGLVGAVCIVGPDGPTITQPDAEGIPLALLAQRSTFRVLLHRDTCALLVGMLGVPGAGAQSVARPSGVLAAARDGRTCGGASIRLVLDDDLRAQIAGDF